MEKDCRDGSVNIYDIARMANVSIATVSRVMNHSGKVSEKTRKKVEKIMAEIDYMPNAFAQGLGLNTMHAVGILVPTIADTFMAASVDYLEKKLAEEGYNCILSCSGFALEGKKLQTKVLLSKHIDALILVGSTYAGRSGDPEETEYIREAAQKVPVFTINCNIEGENVYSAVSDNRKAVLEVTRKLIASGHRSIIFATDSRSYSANKKLKGYLDGLSEAGIPFREDMLLYVEKSIEYVREYLKGDSILPFDALIATEDEIAIGALKYAADTGKKVPEDLSVVGYNNSTLSLACEPELTSIDNHLDEICSHTVDRILQYLQNPEEVELVHKITVPYAVIERSTTRFVKE